jgi:hypothetical protein
MHAGIKNIYCSASAVEEPAPADVVVTMTDGERYVASFIPYGCIADLLIPRCGEVAYFWAKHMVLVPDCKPDTVEQVVRAMAAEGELGEGFERV